MEPKIKSTIQVDQSLLSRLKKCKKYRRESYNETITRFVTEYEDKVRLTK